MNKKEKLSVLQAGIGAYTVSSFIAWLKHDGIQLLSNKDTWTIKIHKSLGVVDVLRLDGHLKKIDVFGDDGMLFVVGMFSAGIAVLVIKTINYFKEPERKKTDNGYTVKFNRPKIPRIRDFEN